MQKTALHALFSATQPLDVIKVRLQLDNELAHHTAKQKTYQGIVRGIITLARQEGVLALYKGLVHLHIQRVFVQISLIRPSNRMC